MGFLRGQVEELDDDEMNFPPEPSAVGKETRPSKDPHSVEYLREKYAFEERILSPHVERAFENWKTSLNGAAIVSGLLAAVAAQLLSFFKDPSNYNLCNAELIHQNGCTPTRTHDFIVTCCHLALILNIMATVIGYALLDTLGGVLVSPSAAVSARMRKQDPGNYIYLREDLLRRYGKNMPLRQVWLATFAAGVLSLVLVVLAYICSEERPATMAVCVAAFVFTFVPSLLCMYWSRAIEGVRRVKRKLGDGGKGADDPELDMESKI